MNYKRLMACLFAVAMVAGIMPTCVLADRLAYEPEETDITENSDLREQRNLSRLKREHTSLNAA